MNIIEQRPETWESVALSEVASINPSQPEDPPTDDELASFVPMKSIEELSGRLDPTEEKKWGEIKKGYTRFQEKDVVFAKITPSMENGKAALARGLKNNCAAGTTELHVLRPSDAIESKYLLYYVLQEGFRREAEANMTGTSGRMRVPEGFMEKVKLPLPPLPEQKRIVAKIEELFSKLDAGVNELEAAEKRLEQYRRAVLKAAMTGEMTQKWRDNVNHEPASELLEHLNNEEDDLTSRYHHEEPIDYPILSVPDNWELIRLSEAARNIQYGYTESAEEDPVGPKFLRISDIQDGNVNWEETPYCEIDDEEKEKYLLEENDLLFARTGGTVGKNFLIKGDIPESVFASYLIRVQLKENISPDFVYAFFQSYFYWNQVHEGKVGIGQPNVNATKLSELVLPLPPLAEQQKIADKVNRKISVIKDTARTFNQEKQRASRLRQAILKHAFEGKLVPQDPDDEPAEKLLERIKNDDETEKNEQATLEEVAADAE